MRIVLFSVLSFFVTIAAAISTPSGLETAAVPEGCGATTCQTVTRTATTGAVITANQGPSNTGRFNVNLTPAWNSENPNPVEFGYPIAISDSGWYSRTRIIEWEVEWSLIEARSDGDFQFQHIQRMIDAAWAAGKQSNFRIIGLMYTTSGIEAQPKWFRDRYTTQCTGRGIPFDHNDPEKLGTELGTPSGCTHYTIDGGGRTNYKVFNHNNTAANSWMSEQLELIAAWGAYFNDPARAAANRGKISSVDLGLAGHWGEGQSDSSSLSGASGTGRWPMPNFENFKTLVNAWSAVLPDEVELAVNFQSGQYWNGPLNHNQEYNWWRHICTIAPTSKQGFSVRNDGLGAPGVPIHNQYSSTHYRYDPAMATHQVLRDCWKYAALDGEPSIQWNNANEITQSVTWNQQHGLSRWNPKFKAFSIFGASVIDPLIASGGYRLYTPTVVIPSTAAANTQFRVAATLRNVGSVPVYQGYHQMYMKFTPTSGGTALTIPLAGEIKKIQPNESRVFTGLAQLTAGTYTALVGTGPKPATNVLQMRFAQTGEQLDGQYAWYSVGTVVVN